VSQVPTSYGKFIDLLALDVVTATANPWRKWCVCREHTGQLDRQLIRLLVTFQASKASDVRLLDRTIETLERREVAVTYLSRSWFLFLPSLYRGSRSLNCMRCEVITRLRQYHSVLVRSLTLAMFAVSLAPKVLSQEGLTQSATASPSAVLVELFTSEGCSDCPPADELLRQVNGHKTAGGQLIVGISEHVSYWDGLGWKDPFSSDLYTKRQNDYGTRFGLESVYTPQMVVNGREQLVGSNGRALQAALATELNRKQISLRINSGQIKDSTVTFTYTASDLPPKGELELVAVLVDDMDQSSVLHGENSGRRLTHVGVARAFTRLGVLRDAVQHSSTLPLPPSFLSNPGAGHHLVLFAQQGSGGPVVGIDTKPI